MALSFINQVIDTIVELMKHYGPIMGFLIIILESILPMLPLAVFIGLNIITFGPAVGFTLSWIATICGSLLSFFAFRKGFSRLLYRKTKVDGKIRKFMNYVSHFPFTKLVLLMAIPFAPAFMINIAAGLSKISIRKFVFATIIGKISIVYFWGYIATNFLESITNPYILFKISVIMVLAYLSSLVIQKILKVGEE
jgi:uncharacterized membrane protein YdjX (TVP38/TMEM64 family)